MSKVAWVGAASCFFAQAHRDRRTVSIRITLMIFFIFFYLLAYLLSAPADFFFLLISSAAPPMAANAITPMPA